MSKPFPPSDLSDYLIRRQGEQTDTAFAKSLGISRPYLTMMRRGQLPSPKTLVLMGMEMVLRVIKSGRIVPLDGLGAYLDRQQRKQPDAVYAASVGLTRQHYYLLKHGLTAVPAPWALQKVGLEIMYREAPKRKAAAA